MPVALVVERTEAREPPLSPSERATSAETRMRRSSSKSGDGSPHISTRRETTRAPICSSSSCVLEVAWSRSGSAGLVALVDQRVELLEHPLGLVLGAEVVEMEQVDGREPLEELRYDCSPVSASKVWRIRESSLGSE